MKKFKIISCLLALTLAAVSLTGCGNTVEETDAASLQQEQAPQEQQAPQRDQGTMAKVVSLDGDQLTVILAEMPGGGENGTPPDGSGSNGNTPPDGAMPPQGGNGPDAASGSAVDSAGAPAGPGQGGQGGGKIEFSGDEATYTLSGDVAITKGVGDSAEEIDLSELIADDVIRFSTTTDDSGNEMISTIQVME